jgi:VanZ family protein
VPVVIYMALIFALSSISRPPDLPSGLGDKFGHTLLYAGLGILLARALAGGLTERLTLSRAAAAVMYSVLYGVTDEIHQMFVPPRHPDLADLAADALGATVGVAMLLAAQALRSRGRGRGLG